jgi:hypothetical protein
MHFRTLFTALVFVCFSGAVSLQVDKTSRLLILSSQPSFESALCLDLRGGGLFGIGSTGNGNVQPPPITNAEASTPSQSADIIAAEAALDDVSLEIAFCSWVDEFVITIYT